jgi:hypothetical protein
MYSFLIIRKRTGFGYKNFRFERAWSVNWRRQLLGSQLFSADGHAAAKH